MKIQELKEGVWGKGENIYIDGKGFRNMSRTYKHAQDIIYGNNGTCSWFQNKEDFVEI